MADFLKMDEVLGHLDLKDNFIAAEFGCGSAHFTISLARTLKKGRVFALDIQASKLSALQGKVKQQKINNIFTILCDLESSQGSTLAGNSLDIVLLPNILFQAENRQSLLEEGKRVLKPGGQMLIIDWLKQTPLNHGNIVKPEEVKKFAKELGLTLKREFSSGDYHYGLLFTK